MQNELSKLDYFTLKVLIGLIEFKNGSVVAQKLQTTQPKVSRALSNMREVLHDELFVRRQYGVEPNIMAKNLYPIAKSIVDSYEEIAQISTSLPEQKMITVAAQEHLAAFLVESISEVSACLGLDMSVNIQPWSDNVHELLIQGKIDYAITVNSASHDFVESIKVGDVRYYFVAAKKNHPLLSQQLNINNLLEQKLVFINYSQVGLVEHWCEKYAKERALEIKVSFKTSSLAMALDHVAKSDDICWTASIFAYLYFKGRSDIDFIDATSFYENELFPLHDFKRYDYYLQYHHSHNSDFTQILSKVLQEKMLNAQKDYEERNI